MTGQTLETVLSFWFEGIDDTVTINKQKPPFSKWFAKNRDFDRDIKNTFECHIRAAADGECKSWEATVEGRLALILLFDQFTRNAYRNTPDMFGCDPKAVELAKQTIMEGKDADLPLIYRVFLFMPLMHAEDLDDQELGVRIFRDLVDLSRRICPENTSYYEYTLDYAVRHRDIIKRFGRFPHRNAILDRKSTSAEELFLNKPAASF